MTDPSARPAGSEPDTSSVDLDRLDLSDPFWWGRGADSRAAAFKKLRDERPIAFFDEFEVPGFPRGPGYWALTRFDDVVTVSRHPELFCSGKGTDIADLPIDIAEFYGSMVNMDAPRHTRLRKLVNGSFTPRMVARIDEDVRVKVRGVIADVAGLGECDFVEEIAARLPLRIICEMMGIPEESWQRVYELTNIILGVGDLELTPDIGTLMGASLEMAALASTVGEDRLADPRDDLVSALMHAEVEGERLSPVQLASFFILLAAAGNETTRTAISHGMLLLQRHPDQRADWAADPAEVGPTAVEEIVRWSTPVIRFRRTVTADTELSGHRFREGDKVVMWYESANRDERHFDDPYRFDLRRHPVDHVGFGAGGPHFCLGANLARREIRLMFEEIFRWLPDLEITTEPDYLQSSFIHGIKRMRCRFTPTDVPAVAAA